MHKPAQVELQLDRPQLPYSEILGPIIAGGSPILPKKAPTTVILRHNYCFSYFILFSMADPSPPFMPALMTQAFKKRVPLQSKHKLLLFQNTLSISFPPLFSSFQTPTPILLRSNPPAIAPVKSSGSSRRKGKEAVYDPPVK